MSLPLISIIIPTYNYAKYITFAIESVLNQNYPIEKIEIIIVDDGSTDNTREVLQKLILSGKVKYYYQENRGKASATRKAIDESKGDIIFNLDADDYFLTDKLKKTVAIYNENSDVVHVANSAQFVVEGKESGQECFPKDITEKPRAGNEVLLYFYNNMTLYGGGSTFSSRATTLKSFLIPDDVDMYIDEFLVLATLARGKTFFIEEPLSVWRSHDDNYTVKKITTDKKSRRMLNSSAGILNAILHDDIYKSEIKQLYMLHHYTRSLKWKEQISQKKIADIIALVSVCVKNRYTLKQLNTYSVFNRLLPSPIINILRKA